MWAQTKPQEGPTQGRGNETGQGNQSKSRQEDGAPAQRGWSTVLWERLQAAHDADLVPWADHLLIGVVDHPFLHDREKPWKRYLQSLLGAPLWLELGVEQRTRYEQLTNPFRKGEFGTDRQFPQRTRVRLGLNGGPFRFLLEFQDSRTHNNGPGDFATNAVVNEHDFQQLFLSAGMDDVFDTGLRADLHVGRINMNVGRRRLIARNFFRNTTNAFDGAHLSLLREEAWRIRAFLTFPVNRLETTLDPVGPANNRMFWGVQFSTVNLRWLKTNFYYFGLNDYRFPITERRQYSTFGTRLYKSPKKGEFDYEGEGALQIGTTGTSQGNKDHFAYMGHAELGYTFDVKWTPRVVAQYDYASGTRDPNGSQNGTFDRLFGARNWELMPTGIFGAFSRSNISSPGGRIYMKPLPLVQFMVKYRAWWLAQARDAWVGSGLQDPTGRSGNFLGQDLELRVKWTPSPNLSFRAGYDHFFKGSYIDNLAKVPGNPPADDTGYSYVMTEIKF